MLSIFNKKNTFLPIGKLLNTDMHAHILPGIDDGAATIAESLILIEGLINLGYKQFVATPHVMNDLYPNTPTTINKAYVQLKQALDDKGFNIPLSYGAEYLIDEGFPEKIEQGLLSFGDNFVLIETMFSVYPPNIEEILFLLQSHGYKPILAHPERYHYIDISLKDLAPFQKHNCYFQPNLLSFAGYYGEREKKIAFKILDAGLIHFLGTDIHHTRHLKALRQLKVSSKILTKIENIIFENLSLVITPSDNLA